MPVDVILKADVPNPQTLHERCRAVQREARGRGEPVQFTEPSALARHLPNVDGAALAAVDTVVLQGGTLTDLGSRNPAIVEQALMGIVRAIEDRFLQRLLSLPSDGP